ncbi:MAG: ABC transporter ATP-binding protein [Opitutales bacterium]
MSSRAAGPDGDAREDIGLRQLWRFLAFSLPYWPSLTGGVITGLLRMGMFLLMPLFLKYVIDSVATPYLGGEITADELWFRVGRLLLLVGGVMIMHAGATVGRIYFPHRAAASAIRDIRFRLFRHLQSQSLSFHTTRPTGGIVARVIADVQAAQQAFDVVLVQLSQMILQSVVILSIFFWTDWQWALVALSITPLFVVTTRLLRRPMRKATRKQRESVERISGRVQERIGMIREVQSFTAEPHEEQQVLDEAEILRHHTLRQSLLGGAMHGSSEITQQMTLLVVVVFGLYRLTQPDAQITTGDIVMFWEYTRRLLQPMQFFAQFYTQLQASAAAADRVFEFLDTAPDIRDEPDAEPLTLPGPPTVTFDHVSFAYPTDRPVAVLDDICFEARPGSKVVLVGESGAGKSTIMSLLPRFYDVRNGRILLNGQDIRGVTLRSLREAISIVPQEPVLFGGTLHENILYGRRDATFEEVRQAARNANAEDFILEMREGYDTIVGERGVGLSGGQVQRIAIARAFLKDPHVLIMDEPTSNLDATSEAKVLAATHRLSEGRTTFIIAHRLSVAREADLIIAMHEGRIMEVGTHRELLEARGVYHTLWRRQVGESLDELNGSG